MCKYLGKSVPGAGSAGHVTLPTKQTRPPPSKRDRDDCSRATTALSQVAQSEQSRTNQSRDLSALSNQYIVTSPGARSSKIFAILFHCIRRFDASPSPQGRISTASTRLRQKHEHLTLPNSHTLPTPLAHSRIHIRLNLRLTFPSPQCQPSSQKVSFSLALIELCIYLHRPRQIPSTLAGARTRNSTRCFSPS
jgi:hypothetical protein